MSVKQRISLVFFPFRVGDREGMTQYDEAGLVPPVSPGRLLVDIVEGVALNPRKNNIESSGTFTEISNKSGAFGLGYSEQ